MDESTLTELIAAIDPKVYELVLLAGGEPSLERALLRTAVTQCRSYGLLSGMVSAPVWARTAASAELFLADIHGLDVLILSYDQYHLEFLNIRDYRHAVAAANARGVRVVVHVAYSSDLERKQLLVSLLELGETVSQVSSIRTVPVGNAAALLDHEIETVSINELADLEGLPRTCILGNGLVDMQLSVHGCCWSSLAKASPLSVHCSTPGEVSSALLALEQSAIFAALSKNGFIDAFDETARTILLNKYSGDRFSSECHLCISAMQHCEPAFWSQAQQQSKGDDNRDQPERRPGRLKTILD